MGAGFKPAPIAMAASDRMWNVFNKDDLESDRDGLDYEKDVCFPKPLIAESTDHALQKRWFFSSIKRSDYLREQQREGGLTAEEEYWLRENVGELENYAKKWIHRWPRSYQIWLAGIAPHLF